MIIDKEQSILGLLHLTREEYGYLFIYVVAFVPLVYKFISPFFILAGLGELSIIINPALMIIGLLILKSKLRFFIRTIDIVMYVVVVGLLSLTPLLFPANKPFFDKSFANFVLFTLPFYFIGLTLDYSKRERVISFVAKIGFWFCVYWQILVFLGIVETEYSFDGTAGEQMAQAYYLLFSVLVFFINIIRRFSFVDLTYFVVSTLLLLFMGTRGPVLVLGLFITVYLFFFHKFNSFNFIKKAGVAVLFFFFIYYLEFIVMTIVPLALSLGFSTRVFDNILEGQMAEMASSSDRDLIWDKLITAIQNDYGGIGYGWLGDRVMLDNGIYSHNFELEILTQFGIFIGGFLLLTLSALIVLSYITIRNSPSRDFWLIMLFVGLVELQLSASYVNHPLFFTMLGCYVSIIRKKSK